MSRAPKQVWRPPNLSARKVIWIRITYFMRSSVSLNSAKINLTLPPTISGRRFSSVIFRPRKCFWRSDYRIVQKRRGSASFLPALMNQRTDLLLIDLSQRFVLFLTQGRYVDRFHVFQHLSAVSCTWNDTAHLLMIENPT